MANKFYFLFSAILFLVATSCFSSNNENATYTTVDPPALKVSATMEIAADGVEDPLFDNIDETRKNKTADYPYNPDYPTNAKVSKLATGLGETVGPATILAVKQGDEMSVSTDLLLRFSKYYFTTPLLPQTNQTAEQILSGIVSGIATAGVGVLATGDGGAVINPFADASSEAATGLNSFIQNSFDSLDTSLPQGYLVTMFFDNNLNLVPEYSGVQRVTEAGSLQKLAVMNQKMASDGFYYTYVTNQSSQVTQFDNLTYIHIEGVLKEATDYYPYGLLCSSATITSVNTSNNYKFQDKEFNRKEFVNTWGLDWYNHGARMYDPELGKWHVQDPALQSHNPYMAMGNNPVIFTDPDGRLFGIRAWVHGFVSGFFSTGGNRFESAKNEANRRAKIDLQLTKGLFVTNDKKTFGGRILELGSRFTYQLPQTLLGYGIATTSNTQMGKIDRVQYFDGATVIRDGKSEPFGAFTIGSFIYGDRSIEADPNNQLFQHEYGHYLQSQLVGFGYFGIYGLQSLWSAREIFLFGKDPKTVKEHNAFRTEQDANIRAREYFDDEYNGNYEWSYDDNPIFNSGYNNEYDANYVYLNSDYWWEFKFLYKDH
jgi:RHS repeat-associated protein